MISTPFRMFRARGATFWLGCSYWWYFASIGCLIPYIPLYYRHLGLSGLQIGVLVATLPLGIAFLAPLWGTLADTLAAHRRVLRGTLLVAALMGLLVIRTTHFGPILLLMILLAICVAAVPALLDSYAITISEREGKSYGRLRVWGSIGFVVAVWFVGWQMGENISNFFLFAYAATLLLACGASFGLPALRPRSGEPIWHGVATIVQDRAVVLLLIIGYLVTSNVGILGNYLSIYVTEIGGSTQLIGAAFAIAALSELPVFIFGTRLLERLNSRRVLMLAITAYLVRFALFSIPPAPSWVLFVQLLHGLSFGAYLMASVTLIHELAGRERAATAQGLLTSVSLGFGPITGSLVGGALLDHIGAVGIFRLAVVGILLAFVAYLFSVHTITARQARAEHMLQPREDMGR
jgi:PPP family 3-phenylpropionic acid transporter